MDEYFNNWEPIPMPEDAEADYFAVFPETTQTAQS